MKIDLHTHILPMTWPDLEKKYGYGGWISMDPHQDEDGSIRLLKCNGDLFRQVDANCFFPEVRLTEMDATGVDVQVLSTVPVMFNYWANAEDTLDFSHFLNNDLAATVSKHPDRFVALGTIPLQEPLLAVEELKRIKHDLKFPGIEIGTHVKDWDLGDEHLDPVFKTCEDLGLSVFVHPWDMPTGGRWNKFWMPWLVGMPGETTHSIVSVLMSGLLLKYPRLKICFSHGAGTFPYTIGRINHGYQVRPDLCATDCGSDPESFLGSFYSDSLVHNRDCLEFLVDIMGEDKVCLGTDYPFPLGERYPPALIDESFSNKKIANKLNSQNVVEFLNLYDNPYIWK